MMRRRQVLRALAASVASATSLWQRCARAQPPEEPGAQAPYLLDLQRDADRFQLDLRTAEGYRVAAWLLRDIKAGRSGWPDPRLLQLLAWGQASFALHWGRATVLVVTSGLRLHQTNRLTEGAARHSFHLPNAFGHFYAVDLDPFGAPRDLWGSMFSRLGYGGVGFYPTHIHIDTGPDRTWHKKGNPHVKPTRR